MKTPLVRRRHSIFFLLLGSLAVLSSLALAKDNDLKIVRVFTGWREATSFKRIAEYFDGQEHSGGEIVLRTNSGDRGGYYFLARIANPGAPVDVQLVLQVVMPGTAAPRSFIFPTSLSSGTAVFNLGLTGADWPDKRVHPVAWKLEVVTADGQMLTTEKSYLWEKPASE